MYGLVSPRYADAIRRPHVKIVAATHLNRITGKTTVLATGSRTRSEKVLDGTVTDDATSNVRRTCDLTLPPLEWLWDRLDTVGGEVTVKQGIRYVNGDVDWVPMGVFTVDVDSLGYSPDDTLQLSSMPDRWAVVQANTLAPSQRSSVASNPAWMEIRRLVESAWPNSAFPFPGWSQLDRSATTKVGNLLWDDGDREAAILQLCDLNSVEVFPDRLGLFVLRKKPQASTNVADAVWTVDAAADGVMIDADRNRDRSRVRNVIIASTTATDVAFTPVEVQNSTAGDPLSVKGVLGYRAEEFSGPFRNSDQARAGGKTRLAKTLGVAQQLSLEAVGNSALDSDDLIVARLPRIDRTTERPVELHLLDTVTHSLSPQGTQSLATRSTRPDTDGA